MVSITNNIEKMQLIEITHPASGVEPHIHLHVNMSDVEYFFPTLFGQKLKKYPVGM